jgi:TRAP-type C4-dicarboxylate transport system permease small subunit
MLESIDKNLNKLYRISGYIASTFLVFVAIFILIGISSRIFGFYIRGLAEYSGYCMASASFFSGYLAFYFIKMWIISYKFQERSEGADEILIWIPQTSVAIGSTIFFISVLHQLVLIIKKN